MSERAPSPPIDPPRASPRRRRLTFAVVAVVLPVVVLIAGGALSLQAMGWISFKQASGTMRPGLLLDERFFVDTGAYRTAQRPDYGDIVVVAVPRRLVGFPGAGPDVTMVQRIIGLPGDRITVAEGKVSVNGRAWPQEPLRELAGFHPGRSSGKAMIVREQAPNGVAYGILHAGGPGGESGTYAVPPGHFFVLGDNRDDSLDSRTWSSAGWYLPAANIIGQAAYVYWSGIDRLDRIGTALK